MFKLVRQSPDIVRVPLYGDHMSRHHIQRGESVSTEFPTVAAALILRAYASLQRT